METVAPEPFEPSLVFYSMFGRALEAFFPIDASDDRFYEKI
jgi:hypothetical protein